MSMTQLSRIFVGNLSSDIDHSWLREIFQQFGRVSQVFVSYKRNYRGAKFGFLSFLYRRDALEAIRCMNGEWVANQRIFVDFARSNRASNGNADLDRRQSNPVVWRRKENQSAPAVKYVSKPEELEWLRRSIIGHVKYPESAEGLVAKLTGDIPFNVSMTMVSAVMMLITFEKHEDCISVIQNGAEWLVDSFDNAELWSPSVTCNEKFVRIRVEGLPLHAWNEEFFEAICDKWGKLIHVDKETKFRERLDCCHFIVRMNYLKELDPVLKVEIDGETFLLRVFKEDQSYVKPLFLRKSNSPSCDKVEDEVNKIINTQNDILSEDTIVQDSQPNTEIQIQIEKDVRDSSNPIILEVANSCDNPEKAHLQEKENAFVVKDLQLQTNISENLNLHEVQITEGVVPIQISSNVPIKSNTLRRSKRPSTSKYRKSRFDLGGLTVENCSQINAPITAEDLLSVGLGSGFVLGDSIANTTRDIKKFLAAE